MKRRNAIHQLVALSGGAVALPFWMQGCRTVSRDRYSLLLAAVVDTVIPGGKDGSPGAVGLGIDKFVEKMVADCYEPPVRDNVRKQLESLDERGFLHATRPHREALLLQLGGSADKNEKDFITLIRNETIRGFNTSQKVMEDYFHYKVAPGHYYGCVAVKA
jgi:hypothetical protein